MRVRLSWLIFTILGLGGCHNACQDLCLDMKNYAEDECGYTVSDESVDACIEAQSGPNLGEGDRGACRQFDSKAQITEQWGCDELADYFTDEAPAE